MAVLYAQRSGRDVTRSLVERIASGHLGAKLRSQVASWHPDATREQLEEAFQEACLRAQLGCHGQREGEVFTWLRTTTHRELGFIERRANRRLQTERAVDVSAPGFDVPASTGSPEEELIRRDDEEDLKRVTHALLERLSESQRRVAALHTHGRKRREIATQLGLSPRTVKRMLESIMALSRAELVRLAGQGCESGETLIARFAFGLARPREMREAQQHLATCPRCGALYERLDMWRQKVAAVLPLPVVQKAHPGFIERAMHGAAERLSAFAHRGGSRGSGLRERVEEVSGQVKQHATAAYYRTVDPTPLAGIRPGTAAATVAGCLAIGGGATYCVQQGVDATGGLMGVSAPAHYQRHEPRHRKVAHVVQPPRTPADPAPAPPTVTTPPQPVAQAPPQTSTQTQPAPAPQNEFEPSNASAAIAATATPNTSSSGRSQPAPAPAGGPSEFGGP